MASFPKLNLQQFTGGVGGNGNLPAPNAATGFIRSPEITSQDRAAAEARIQDWMDQRRASSPPDTGNYPTVSGANGIMDAIRQIREMSPQSPGMGSANGYAPVSGFGAGMSPQPTWLYPIQYQPSNPFGFQDPGYFQRPTTPRPTWLDSLLEQFYAGNVTRYPRRW